MRYLVIADHVAHEIADILDLATHPTQTKSKINELIQNLKNAQTVEEHLQQQKTGDMK